MSDGDVIIAEQSAQTESFMEIGHIREYVLRSDVLDAIKKSTYRKNFRK